MYRILYFSPVSLRHKLSLTVFKLYLGNSH
jgi:hypothetical protein